MPGLLMLDLDKRNLDDARILYAGPREAAEKLCMFSGTSSVNMLINLSNCGQLRKTRARRSWGPEGAVSLPARLFYCVVGLVICCYRTSFVHIILFSCVNYFLCSRHRHKCLVFHNLFVSYLFYTHNFVIRLDSATS